MGKIKLYHKVIILLAVAASVFGMWYFETGCLIQRFFQVPCPTCGMTRAFFAFLNGDFSLSFQLHPMLFSIPILIIMFLFSDELFNGKLKKISVFILFLILIGFVVNYLSKF